MTNERLTPIVLIEEDNDTEAASNKVRNQHSLLRPLHKRLAEEEKLIDSLVTSTRLLSLPGTNSRRLSAPGRISAVSPNRLRRNSDSSDSEGESTNERLARRVARRSLEVRPTDLVYPRRRQLGTLLETENYKQHMMEADDDDDNQNIRRKRAYSLPGGLEEFNLYEKGEAFGALSGGVAKTCMDDSKLRRRRGTIQEIGLESIMEESGCAKTSSSMSAANRRYSTPARPCMSTWSN